MSTFKEIQTISPYGLNDSMLELVIDKENDGYLLENTITLIGTYTFSIWIKGNKNYTALFDILGTSKAVDVTTQWQKISYVINVTDLTNKNILILPMVGTTTYLFEGYLAEGNLDNSWLPAPEDGEDNLASVKSELIQKADSIEQKVTDSEGRITSLRTDLNGITGRVETAEGKITDVTATANGLTTKVQDAEKNISTLQQDSKTFTTEIANAKGDISQIRQDATALTTRVQTAEGDVSQLKIDTSGLQTDVTNAKGDISQIRQDASALTSRVKTAEGDISTLTQSSGKLSSEIESAKGEISTLKQTAGNIQLQVNSSVKKTVEEFYLSTSPTALVGGTWSTAQPTWTQGKYIWRRTKVTFGNDKTEYTPSVNGVCITGNTGMNGQNGSNGVSVTKIENFYLVHASNTGVTTSTQGWTPQPPNTTEQNKYLWNYEKTTYSNGKTETTVPCVIGVFGRFGKDGKGISSIEEFYQVSASNSTAPTSWVKEPVPQMTSTNRYLWNYEKITYTDKTVYESKKRVIGVYGEKGDRGLQGLQGNDGKDGIAGANGSDGKTSYFHIKYSSVAKPTTATQMTETPSTYIGTYVDFIQVDSNDPSKYTWSKFVGTDGKNGIAGTNGQDGKTSYLHIAYANSADGSSGFSTTDSTNKLYIGQYTDFVQADSTDYKKYSWTKIKGENGINGKDGKGIKSYSITYQASTSGTVAPTGQWQSTIPNVPQGQYLWSRTVYTYTDNTNSTSYSVAFIPKNGVNGQDGHNGTNGTGVANMTQQYYLSDSKTTQSGGSWITTMPTWSVGKYLWTRYQINYTNPTSVKYTTPVCDSSWEAVNEIHIGGRNLVLDSGIEAKNNQYLIASYHISPSEGVKANATTQNSSYGYLEEDVEYTLSVCWTPNLKTTKLSAFFSQGYYNPISFNSDGTNNKQLSYGTFKIKYPAGKTPTDDIKNADLSLYRYPNETNVTYEDITIHWVKVERGNKATDWSHAPEDIQSNLDDLNTQVDSHKEQISKLQVDTGEINVFVQTIEKNNKEAIDSINKDIATLTKQTGLAITEDQLQIYVKQELDKGTDKVVTNTGFTFDDTGLTVSKTNSELATQITEDGMKVLKNNETVLEANNTGVNAQNLHATTYLIVGNNSRFEDFGQNRTGCFWIGGV